MLKIMAFLLAPVLSGEIQPDITMWENDPVRLTAEANINQEYLVDLFTFTISSVSNQPLLNYTLQNQGNEPQTVYLQIRVSSDNHGLLISASQNELTPIVIGAGQTIQFTNLDIINNTVPGTDGEIYFNFTLNSSARNIYTRLLQGAVPGNDRFVVETTLSGAESEVTTTGNTSESRVEFITTIPEEALKIGAEEDEENEGIFQQSVDLTEETALFTWSGRENVPYRLVVARDTRENDTDQLIENRFQQPYSEESTRDLQNDIVLDISVRGNRYQLPEALSGQIEPGYQYSWQVRGMLPTTNGDIEVISGIRAFTTGISVEQELYELLVHFFGEERVNRMVGEGMELHRLEIEGVIYSAREAVEYLHELKQKIEQNRATIGS